MSESDRVGVSEFAAEVASQWKTLWAESASSPPEPAIETLVEIAFWASLETDELRPTKTSLRVVPREWPVLHWPGDVEFAPPNEIVTPSDVGAVAAAARSDASLTLSWRDGVWFARGIQAALGRKLARLKPWADQEIAIEGPGVILASGLNGRRSLLFRRGVLTGNEDLLNATEIATWGARVVEIARSKPDGAASGEDTRRVRSASDSVWSRYASRVLCAAVTAIVDGRHGGTVLIVASLPGDDAWRSIQRVEHRASVAQILHVVETRVHKEAARANAERYSLCRAWVDRVVDLASVDGAVVIDEKGKILGFRAVIAGGGDADAVAPTMVGPDGLEASTSDWGTRRSSAARFVASTPHAVAIVISQDGDVRVMSHEQAGRVRLKTFPVVRVVLELEPS